MVDWRRIGEQALLAAETAIQSGSKRGLRLIGKLRDTYEEELERTDPMSVSVDHQFAAGHYADSDRVATVWGRDAYDTMAKEDPVIRGDLKRRITDVACRPIVVEPAEKRPTAEQKRRAQFVQDNIDQLGAQNKRIKTNPMLQIYELCRHALVSGRAIGDPVMVWDKPKARWWLDYVGWRRPEYFEFDCDDYGRIRAIRDVASQEYGKTFDPADLIVASWLPVASNWYGEKELRPVWRAYRLKDLAFKQWAIFIQKAASGAMFAVYPDKKINDSSYITAVLEAGKKLAAEVFSAFPESAKIEQLKTDSSPAQVWQWCIDSCNREIHAGLMNLNLDSSSASGGGLNQGGYSEKLAVQDAGGLLLIRFVEDVLCKEFVERICNANFDVSAGNFRYPVARIDIASKADPGTVSGRVLQICQAFPGVQFDRDWINENCGVLTVGEGPLASAPPPSPFGGGFLPSGAADESAQLAAGKPPRKRQRPDWTRIDKDGDKLAATMEDEFRRLVEWAQSHPEEVSAGEWMDGEDERLALFKRGLTNSLSHGAEVVAKSKPAGWKPEKPAKSVKLAAGDEGDGEEDGEEFPEWMYGDFIPEAAIDELRDRIGDFYWSKFEEELRKEFRQIVEDGAREGWSNNEIADKMAIAAGLGKTDAEGKPVPEDNWRMRRAARQANADAYGAAKAKAGQEAGWVDGFQVIGPEDPRMTPLCEWLNGKYLSKTDKKALRNPYHWGCRRDLMPVMADDEGVEFTPWSDIPSDLLEYIVFRNPITGA